MEGLVWFGLVRFGRFGLVVWFGRFGSVDLFGMVGFVLLGKFSLG